MPKSHPGGRPKKNREIKPRRIPLSREGRMRFTPGLPHVLDGEIDEARRLRDATIEEITQLRQLINRLNVLEDAAAQIEQEERALKQFLWQHYQHYKHRDHILAVFLSIRRRRLLNRLQSARIAIQMATTMLEPDEKILQELRAAVDYQRRLEEIVATRRKPNQASFRVQGNSREEIQAQLEQFEREAREHAQEAKQNIDHRHIYGDADTTRRQLEAFDEQVRVMRSSLVQGIGWHTSTWVKRIWRTRESQKYFLRGEETPQGIMEFEGAIYGPYTHYQWQEPDTRGVSDYTIQLGGIPLEKEEKAQEPEFDEDNTPWPDM